MTYSSIADKQENTDKENKNTHEETQRGLDTILAYTLQHSSGICRCNYWTGCRISHYRSLFFLKEIQWNEPCYTELISLLLELASYHMSIYGK